MRSVLGLGPLLCATVATPDLDAHAEIYAATLGWTTTDAGTIGSDLAAAWGVPGQSGARFRLLGARRGRRGGVRLVETDGVRQEVLRHPGWRSIEICVVDVNAVRVRIAAAAPPFTIVGEPAPIPGHATIRAMQVLGPAGELLYLTEIGPQSTFALPRPTELIDHVFIGVISAPCLRRARSFYERAFGVAGPPGTLTAPIESISRVLGLPLEHAHEFCTLQLAGRTLVEIDQHPPALPQEPPAPADRLAPGTALMTFAFDAGSRPTVELVGRAGRPTGELYAGGASKRFSVRPASASSL